jgi:hypothetical protein
MNFIRIIFIIFICFITAICLQKFGFADSILLEPRNYTIFITDELGNSFLKIRCEYIGEKPKGKFGLKNILDYNKKHYAFYNLYYKNLSNKPIKLISAQYYQSTHKTMTVYQVDSKGHMVKKNVPAFRQVDYEKNPDPKGNIVGPLEERIYKNSWVGWAKGKSEVFYKDTKIKYDGKEYTFTTHKALYF